MNVTEHYGGCVTLTYDPSSHSHLFKPRMHPQQPSYPTQDVLDWLQPRYPEVYWGIQHFYGMRIMFPNKETAMLFKLTFA